jgi:hypothetical protein
MMNELIQRDVELASRLASQGASLKTIAMALCITVKELTEISATNPELKKAIELGRAIGIGDALQNLHKLATLTDDVGAIKYYLGIQGAEYRIDKAAVEITNDNRQITLPTLEEARKIIMNDPALLPPTPTTDEPTK